MQDNEIKVLKVIEPVLIKYLDKDCINFLLPYFLNYPLKLEIIPPRQTFSGQCRMPVEKNGFYKIKVAGSLNKSLFFLVFLHEIAHMVAHNKYYPKRISPHGKEWGMVFYQIVINALNNSLFDSDLSEIIKKTLKNKNYITNSNMANWQRRYDNLTSPEIIRLNSIPDNAVFILKNGLSFKKQKKLRTHFLCIGIHDKRMYRVHANAEVVSYVL